jgi:hypothetical protein
MSTIKTYLGFCPVSTEPGLFRQVFIKVTNKKFHENPFTGSRADKCGQTEGQADKKNLIGCLYGYANAFNNDKNLLIVNLE